LPLLLFGEQQMFKVFAVVLLLGASMFAGASYKIYQIVTLPHVSTLSQANKQFAQNQDEFGVEVLSGESFSSVTKKLEEKDIISNPDIFYWYARVTAQDKKIKPGFYEFEKNLTFNQVLNKMVLGDIKIVNFGFQEGWNSFQVFEKVKLSFPNITRSEWEEVFSDVSLIKLKSNIELNFRSEPHFRHLEGFLFPETYKIPYKANAKKVIQIFLDQFSKNFTPQIVQKGKTLGLTPYQVVILASIIEKETGKEDEMPRISAVFHNRMRIKMRLQTDPTIIYGMWHRYDGNIRKKDLQEPGPYNTYLNGGLTPTPISNPGKKSLEAAVNPSISKELYFVGKGDGTHHFSKTLAEHNKAVYQYQIKR
jgi:UPF0755 protein